MAVYKSINGKRLTFMFILHIQKLEKAVLIMANKSYIPFEYAHRLESKFIVSHVSK